MSKTGWDYLHDKSREFNEYDLINEKLLQSQDEEVYLHIFMIEKFDSNFSDFTQFAYKRVFKHIRENTKLDVAGISGVTASKAAGFIALHKIGRYEVKPCHEYIIRLSSGKEELVYINHQSALDALYKKGATIKNRLIISSISKDQPSVIWKWLQESWKAD